MLKNQIRVQYFSNYKTFKKNISLTDDERNAIQNSIIALIQGLEYTEKINVLSKISIESRLAKEDYEIRLNHSILSDFLSFFSQSFITFFSMLIGAIIGFSGSIISNMLQELNLKDFNSYIIIAKTVVSSFAFIYIGEYA